MSLFQFNSSEPDKVSAASSKQQLAERIVDDKPAQGYRPGTPLHFFFGFDNQLPPIWRFYREIEVMLIHPRVKIALDYYKSGLAAGEFKVTARNPDVAAYVEEQFRRCWQTSLGKIQEGYDYGWIGGEVVYRMNDDGRLAFDHLKTFHPRDVKVLTQDHDYYGIRVTSVAGKPGNTVDLWGPKRGLAKGFWYAHRSKHGSLWGLSQVIASWRPWRRLACRDGGEDIIDLALYKFGTQPVIVEFPPGQPNADPAHSDNRGPSNQEKATAVGELLKSGSVIAISSMPYDGTNVKKWSVQPTDRAGSFQAASLIEYNDHLEKQISIGIGVPPELLEASETGSGYSGRQIPLEAFYEGQQAIGREIIRTFREQVVEPLVKWIWGEEEAEFDVEMLPLLQTRSKRIGFDPANAQPGQADRQRDDSGHFLPASPAQVQMMATTFNESQHPRDDTGEWTPAHLTSSQWDKHLQEHGERGGYGPGLGKVKLAHRTHVEDALRKGVDLPDIVRAEYPDLDKKHPSPAVRPQYLSKKNAGDTVKRIALQKQMAAAKVENRNAWAERIRAGYGVHPKHVHAHAQEVMARDRQEKDEHNAMVADAFMTFAKRGVSRQQIMAAEDVLPGSDEVAMSIANRHPGHLGTGTAGSWAHAAGENYDPNQADPMEKLMEFMHEGKRPYMDDDQAYGQVEKEVGQHNQEDPEEAARAEEELKGGHDPKAGTLEPHEMDRGHFQYSRKKATAEQDRGYYRAGFVGKPAPDKDELPANRAALAQKAGLQPNTPEHIEAVTKWPLHKLHVAAAITAGKYVPHHVVAQYPDLKPTMMSAMPGEEDQEEVLSVALAALKPFRRRMVNGILNTLLNESPADWWTLIRQFINRFRNQSIQALAIARVGVALAAMRRVVISTTSTSLSDLVKDQLPAVPLPDEPIASPADFAVPPDEKPVVHLSIIEDASRDLLDRKLLTRSAYDQLTADARDEAFTVAGMEADSSMESVRDLIDQAVTEGRHGREWVRSVRETLDGSDPFLSSAHAENVFRTNIASAYSKGLDTVIANPMVADLFPYVRYVAIRDARVRPWHLALEQSGIDGGDVYWVDDPIWNTIKPPCDYQCRCGRIFLTIEQAARHGLAEAQTWLATGIEPQHGLGRLPANWQQSESFMRV